MYVLLVVDPPTTAGAGIPASGGLDITSTKSGPGSFHLYAVDDVAGSFGIGSYSVKLTGALTSLNNRSPFALWDDADVNSYVAGFGLLRTASGVNPVSAEQGAALGGVSIGRPLIGGFGQTSSNFAAKMPSDFYEFFLAPTSGQWGNYADPNTQGTIACTGHSRNALFLAEGTYTGAAPTVDLSTGTAFTYWTSDPATNPGAARATAATILGSNPFNVPEPGSAWLTTLAGAMLARFGSRSHCCRRCTNPANFVILPCLLNQANSMSSPNCRR
jgi:hypothetical protein